MTGALYYGGGLIGYNTGAVSYVSASGSVAGSSGSYWLGGLVGASTSSVDHASASGSVAGDYNVGGLIGENQGALSAVTASGPVRGIDSVGGLVGLHSGTLTQATATGAVGAASNVGGVVGLNNGTVIATYWDTQTSGQAAGFGSGNLTGAYGLTTEQLQATNSLPGGVTSGLGAAFSGGMAGGGVGLYPYLTILNPGGVQAVSGFAYSDGGQMALTSPHGIVSGTLPNNGRVSVVDNGALLGTAATGANGYYYLAVPTGTLAVGSGLAAYTQTDTGPTPSAAQNGFSYRPVAVAAANTSLDVDGGWRVDHAGAGVTSLTGLNAAESAAVGGTTPAGFSLSNREIDAAGAFAIDTVVTQSGTLALATPGAVTQSAAITAGNLLLTGTGTFTLTRTGNGIGTLAAAAGSVSLADGSDLAVGTVSGAAGGAVAGVTTSGAVSLVSGGDLTIESGAAVSGQTPVLAAVGAFVNQAGSAAVTATSGRWLIYSNTPGSDTFGSLDSGNRAVFNASSASLPPGSVTQSGDRYLFATQPTLTVATTNDSKAYGSNGTAQVAGDYTITGFDPGATGAYLGDTAATATSGGAERHLCRLRGERQRGRRPLCDQCRGGNAFGALRLRSGFPEQWIAHDCTSGRRPIRNADLRWDDQRGVRPSHRDQPCGG